MKGSKRLGIAILAVVIGALALGAQVANAAPGKLDRSFGGGIVSVQPPLDQFTTWQTGAADADARGRIYVLEQSTICVPGSLPPSCTIRNAVSRYLNDGSRDTSYGQAGTAVVTELGGEFAPSSLAVDSEGRAVVGQQAGPTGLIVSRLTPTGEIDTGFGSGGATRFGCFECRYQSVHVLLDAKGGIHLVATQSAVAEGPVYGVRELFGTVFARLSPHGVLDGSYGNGGIRFASLMELGDSVGVRSNGAVLASSGRYLTKISPRGDSVNRDFAPALRISGATYYSGITPLPNGDIAVSGVRRSGKGFVARVRPGGALLRKFGRKGIAPFPKRSFEGMDVDARGRIFLMGAIRRPTRANRPFIMRLRPLGKVESRFRDGLADVDSFEGVADVFYAGSHPALLDRGNGGGCRAYCLPHPLLFRFEGGPGARKK